MEKEKAFEIMRKMLVPIGCDEQMDNLNTLNVSNRPSMERLLAFYDFMGAGGVGQFVERKLIQEDTVLPESLSRFQVPQG